MVRGIRDLVVGDRIHVRYPSGASPYEVVVAVTDAELEACSMGSPHSSRYSRESGLELGPLRADRISFIDSVAALPPALVARLDERDRRFRAWWSSRTSMPDTAFPRLASDRAATEEARAVFRANPLYARPPDPVADLIALTTDSTRSLEQRAEAARILGRYDFPTVFATLTELASSADTAPPLLESAVRGLAGLFADWDTVDEQFVDRLLPVARDMFRAALPWIDVGRARHWCCRICGVDTDTIEEYYMLHRELWIRVSPYPLGHLCVGCVEDRLGRLLTADDFTDTPINTAPQRRSARLADRLSRKC